MSEPCSSSCHLTTFTEWEKGVHRLAKQDGIYHMRDAIYYDERSDFAMYRPDLLAHRIFMHDSRYVVLNVGVGTGVEAKIPMHHYVSYRREPDLYIATNVNTPPDFELTEQFVNLHYPTIPFEYRSGFLLEEHDESREIALILASRVVEWSDKPHQWFSNAYEALAPGGIGIIHTATLLKRAGHIPAIEAARQAGINFIISVKSPELDQIVDTSRILFYKPTETEVQFPEWINDPKHIFQTGFNSVMAQAQ